ncbi:hypothetical protein K491DRAFT_172567 [Lophiostoma macrostomum CBS 122681]|uniref:Uncharacterized protein n=1 Tax=Lophiostoma macrostomum CBS 122681 TaxID=1314788 RepID=A0A6A6SPB4_9PLEO|nr:hypothetical protein K491DRAFT_172567 [Lophiostoma macrostomum CBS 122681]
MEKDHGTHTPASLTTGAGIAIGVVIGTLTIGLMVGGWAIYRNRRRRAEQDTNILPTHNRDIRRLSRETFAVPPDVHQPVDRRVHSNAPVSNMIIELDDFDHRGQRLARPVQRSDLADFRPASGMYAYASLEDQHRSHLEHRGHVVSFREPGARRPTPTPIESLFALPRPPTPAISFITEDGSEYVGTAVSPEQVITVADYIANRTVPRRPRRPRRPDTPSDGSIIPPILRGQPLEMGRLPLDMMEFPPEMFGLGPEMIGLGDPFDQEGLPRHWSNESVDTLPRSDANIRDIIHDIMQRSYVYSKSNTSSRHGTISLVLTSALGIKLV